MKILLAVFILANISLSPSWASEPGINSLPALTPLQKQLALQTWQSQNLVVIVAESLRPGVTRPTVNTTNELGQRYASMMSIMNQAVQTHQCDVETSNATGSDGLPNETFEISGAQCPISYNETFTDEGLQTAFKAQLPSFQSLNDALEAQMSLNDSTVNHTTGSGKWGSRTLGSLPFTVVNIPGGNNSVTSIQTVQFPGFVAELSATHVFAQDGSSSDGVYLLNGEALNPDEIATYLHLSPAFK